EGGQEGREPIDREGGRGDIERRLAGGSGPGRRQGRVGGHEVAHRSRVILGGRRTARRYRDLERKVSADFEGATATVPEQSAYRVPTLGRLDRHRGAHA